MRKLFGVLAAGLFALGVAGQAHAGPLQFAGTLAVQIAALPPIAIPGGGILNVNGSGGGGHLTSFTVPASPFAITGIVVPVTDPGAFPIVGVQVTAHNAGGLFVGGGGTMSINGVAKVCLFAPCSGPPANLSVPLSVVGVGGSFNAAFLVNITVIGAPWTTGTAAIGTVTAMGFIHGPASAGASSAANASGVVSLVTPIFISTNIGASAVVPAFGILSLHFVPEPGTLVLLSSGIAGLVMFGRSRRS